MRLGAVRAIVQARMSSRRLPGKVLAPLRGRPLIDHVVEAARAAARDSEVVVATSTHATDDPLAAYLERQGVIVFRGALDDVFGRFRDCLDAHPCDWFFRVCADSPFLDTRIAQRQIAAAARGNYDLVTTLFPPTFPRGQDLELIRTATFRGVDPDELTADDREHVTPFFYRHPNRFRIFNVESEDPRLANSSLVVDTIEDLLRLEGGERGPWRAMYVEEALR